VLRSRDIFGVVSPYLPHSLMALCLRAGQVPPMWNAVECLDTIAHGTTREREGENVDAMDAVVVVEQALAGDAHEVRALLQPRFSRGEPVTAADAVPSQDACLVPDSLL